MVKNTKGTGLMIYNTVQELKFLKTGRSIAENSGTARSTVWVLMFGRMGLVMRGNGMGTKLKDLAFSNGRMVEDLREVGCETNFMVVVFTPGQMAEATMASTTRTRSKGLEFTNGLMERNMKVTGKMANSTDRASSQTNKASQESVYGRTVSA